MRSFNNTNPKPISRAISWLMIMVFTVASVMLPRVGSAENVLNLPQPGVMVDVTSAYTPAIINGMTIFPDNPLMFDFIVDIGDDELSGIDLKKETAKLVKYFLASLTIPEDEMWVNLSPYEKDRIIPNEFGQTEMGRDLLAQDYMLKQITASLMYPEDKLGNEFWQRVYQKAQEEYGSSDIPMNTFNKVWIIPEKADVFVEGNSVYVVNSHLKVLLEEDYLALDANVENTKHGLGDVEEKDLKKLSEVSSKVIKELILPELEREVNEGKTFANLRQIYNSLILAAWYKKNLKESLLGKIYVDQGKTVGVDVTDKDINQKIYDRYVKAFEKGVYEYIKEDYNPETQEIVPRKYFLGGMRFGLNSKKILGRVVKKIDGAMRSEEDKNRPRVSARVELEQPQEAAESNRLDAASITNDDDDVRAFLEAEQAIWRAKDFSPEEAQVIAYAKQTLEPRRVPDYYLRQLETMTIDQLDEIINQGVQDRRKNNQILARANVEGASIKILEFMIREVKLRMMARSMKRSKSGNVDPAREDMDVWELADYSIAKPNVGYDDTADIDENEHKELFILIFRKGNEAFEALKYVAAIAQRGDARLHSLKQIRVRTALHPSKIIEAFTELGETALIDGVGIVAVRFINVMIRDQRESGMYIDPDAIKGGTITEDDIKKMAVKAFVKIIKTAETLPEVAASAMDNLISIGNKESNKAIINLAKTLDDWNKTFHVGIVKILQLNRCIHFNFRSVCLQF